MKTLNISPHLQLPIEAVTQTFAILAKRGVGKTYTGMVMVEEMLAANQQVVVADPIGVWWGLRSSADGKSPGFPIVVFGGEHGDVPLEEHAGELVAQAIIENGFSAVLDLSLFRKGAQVRFMTAFAETLYRLNRKPLHYMVDEADEFAPQRPMNGAERLLGAFEDIVRRGRARGLGVTLITQRAAVLNKNVLTQIEVLVCLRTIAPQDRDAIESWIEVHGTKKQQDEMMASLPSLERGTAYFWSPGWLDIFKKIQVRERTTFDSSATPKVGEVMKKPKALAEVNLDQLGEQIKATAIKVKDNDPAELKKIIARLRKDLADPPIDVQEAVIKKLKLSANTKEVIKEVPVFTKSNEAALIRAERAFSDFKALIESKALRFPSIEESLKIIRPAVQSHASLAAGYVAHAVKSTTPRIVQPPRLRAHIPAARSFHPEAISNGDASIGKCERAILTALAQYPQGRTAVQVALLTEYSVNSGGFNNSLGKLRSLGYITRGNPIQITEEGRANVGSYDELPTGLELAGHWIHKLPKCEAAILQFLTNNHPNAFTSQQVAEAIGYSASSGGFNNSLGRLRTLELITRGQPMKASDEFFQ